MDFPAFKTEADADKAIAEFADATDGLYKRKIMGPVPWSPSDSHHRCPTSEQVASP